MLLVAAALLLLMLLLQEAWLLQRMAACRFHKGLGPTPAAALWQACITTLWQEAMGPLMMQQCSQQGLSAAATLCPSRAVLQLTQAAAAVPATAAAVPPAVELLQRNSQTQAV
jgi:hypothetical protein